PSVPRDREGALVGPGAPFASPRGSLQASLSHVPPRTDRRAAPRSAGLNDAIPPRRLHVAASAPVDEEPDHLRGPRPLEAPLPAGGGPPYAPGLRRLLRPLGHGLSHERRGRRGARPPAPDEATPARGERPAPGAPPARDCAAARRR